ncbi:MAG: hypothetical protein BWX89_00253 [candidate division TA06 bacterium ADurb.Bin131]|uniref:Uncharacterized protein n=1 Tax=candidate division TA06 bacterium ADurb.Bin131 TaxID=1852827 RepID=A0A1V6CDD4_UNCT6|nr:MAG: hypothetical protein BWX89_00253 [candidate division TA06 bacterium ADurb.Bin131]
MAEDKKKQPEKKITISSTKKEMLEAYNQLLKELEEKEAGQVSPERKIDEKKSCEVVEVASSLSTDGIVQSIGNLKSEIGKLLSEISDKLENEVKKFNATEQAVKVKESELQEVYEISRSAQTLAALIEAQNRKKQEFEEEMARRKEEIEQQLQQMQEAKKIEEEKHKEEMKEQEAEEKKRREREKEEYIYNFNRQKKIEMDRLQDEKEKLEKEFKQRMQEKEKELSEKEQKLSEKEEELNLLRKKVDNFPKEIEAITNRVIKETTEKLQKEFATTEALMKKDFAGERNVFLARIESMEKTIKQQEQEIEKLSRQLESAYKRIEDIAVKTVATGQGWKSIYQQEDIKKENQK